MWKARIVASTLFLLLVLGTLPLEFAQDTPTSASDPNTERQASVLGLVRTINTAEVNQLTEYGAYAQWPMLLARNQEAFDWWLKKFHSLVEPNPHFGDMPEILPGWNLRMNVQADGKGYLLLLSDSSDKTGFAWVTDESGIIRRSKYIQ